MFQAWATGRTLCVGLSLAWLEERKRGRGAQDEVLKVLQASSCWALETPYGKDSAVETFKDSSKAL